MNKNHKTGLWNAKRLSKRSLELEVFFIDNRLDVMLIYKTRFTAKNHIRIPKFTIYYIQHHNGSARGGTV